MEQPPIPVNGVLKRTAEIDISATSQTTFQYISNSDVLPAWLKKCGPINGAVKTVINKGPYSVVGANRTVYFDNGDTIVEQLTWFEPYVYYSYSVTNFSDFLRHLTNIGYGQWWFENIDDKTHVKWVYTFVPKNFFSRMVLSLFLSLFYTKFMNQSLQLAKTQIEK